MVDVSGSTPAGAALSGRCAVVTGASGFIGRHLCRALTGAGCVVHATSRAAADPAAASAQPGPSADVTWHRCELSESGAVDALIQRLRPDYIFHLASHVMGAPDLAHVLPAFQGNLQSTVNLLVASAHTPCKRFILMGSLVEPTPGEDERVPTSPYAASKWASSDYARMFHRLYGLPVAIARTFMVYGPDQPDRSKLVPYAIARFRAGQELTVGNGERLIDWVYVDDVVAGLLAMAIAPDIDGDSVDLGSGQLISTRDFVSLLSSLMSSTDKVCFSPVSDRPLEPIRQADIAASFRKTSWQPRVALEDGLRRTIAWYTSQPA